jgi:glycosyltransferase involved in cell wall biosynthesis
MAAVRSKLRRRARWAGCMLLLLSAALLAPQLRSGTELVRARNALTLGADLLPGQDWQPPALPSDFKQETRPVDPYFADVARRLDLAAMGDDWQRTLAISAHLLGSAPKLSGGAIQSDLRTTHQRIVQDGHGYCGDFVRVFIAVANAAGMRVRPWAFSFDGFGGHGHIWVEVWNRQQQRWQLADVFQNYQYVLDDGVPLSALQTRTALVAGDPHLQLRPLRPALPVGWKIEAKARDYLRRGLQQWYVPWGNNVMSVDGNLVVRAAGAISRALEGLAAIAVGLQPQVRLLVTPDNAAERASLRAVRTRLFGAAVAGVAGLGLLLLTVRGGRQASPKASGDGWPRVCVVGPLPPPSGGMANQCEQLLRLLRADGASAELVRTNAPYRPALLGRIPMLRALARLIPYGVSLWRASGRSDVMHVLANSGWAWHLFAAPALWIGRLRGVPVVVNYRGGLADDFLAAAPTHVHRSLRRAALRVTPSDFLRRVFARHGLDAEVIPNIIDLERFGACLAHPREGPPHIVVARNLEPIYGLDTAIRALALLRQWHPQARLTLAGSGPQREELQALAASLGVGEAVSFPGRVDHADMPALYAQADVALNPSTVDNMPNSVLEAHASQLPLVSTNVGGVPDIVDDGISGLLVPPGDAAAMAQALRRVLDDTVLAASLVHAGRSKVQAYAWPQVRQQWLMAYRRACAQGAVA